MNRTDRRDRVALDQAYGFYRTAIVHDEHTELHDLVNALKTVSHAITAASSGTFKLTKRLWVRIELALFDKLITSYSSHLVMLDADGAALKAGEELPDDCTIQLHPQGLRRADDVFRMPFADLPPLTQTQLRRIWKERGPKIRREDFLQMDCSSGVCAMKPFAVGHEVLQQEAVNGKQMAYQQWWDLYWQAYCTPNQRERELIVQQMSTLETVFGNLYY